MSERFSPLASLPGWEATAGRFALNDGGRLRYRRTVRRIGSSYGYPLDLDTPRAFEILIANTAAAQAHAAEVA